MRDVEIIFLQEIIQIHPNSPKPIVVGNCQGGWAAMLLASSAPELIGPIVLNSSPISYWAGKIGDNPMRYTGGIKGGVVPALLLAALGNGLFDGANLVANFESLNPANSLFSKYYKLYTHIDSEAERFLDFEKWWGGYCFMTEAEMRWILDNLFIGNKLANGEAVLGLDRVDFIVKLVHQQAMIVDFEPKKAVNTLCVLLNSHEKQRKALKAVMEIAGPRETMYPFALKMYGQIEEMLSNKHQKKIQATSDDVDVD